MATINVPASANLQAALDNAQSSDTLILEADARFPTPHGFQPFLVKRSGTTIQSQALSSLPSGRVSLADKAKMPHLVATGPLGAITLAPGVTDVKLIGLDCTNQSDGSGGQHCNTIIPLGEGTNPDAAGNRILFDRVLLHPQEDGTDNYYRTCGRGVFANAGAVKFTKSYIGGFTGFYAHSRSEVIDAVAFASVVGGPFEVDDCTIQAGFNPIFLGGGDPGVPANHTATVSNGTLTQATLSNLTDLQVGDKIAIEVGAGGDQFACGTVRSISGSTITYTQLVRNEGGEGYVVSSTPPKSGGQARWRGYTIKGFTATRSTISIDRAAAQFILSTSNSKPKAYAEIKLLESGLFNGCIFEGWPTGIAITLRNQNGFSPWSTVKDVDYQNCVFREFSSQIIQLFSGDRLSETGSNIRFINTLFEGPIRNSLVGTYPSVAYTAFGHGIVFDHCTVLNKQDVPGGPMMIGLTPSGVTMKDSIMYFNTYGTQCAMPGNQFSSCWPGFIEKGNIIVNNANVEARYITGADGAFPNSFVADASFALTDYQLPAGSPFKGKASDGKDPGVDMAVLLAAIGGQLPAPVPLPVEPAPPTPPVEPPAPAPNPTPAPTPAPAPAGSRALTGYLKVGGTYFDSPATVTVTHSSMSPKTQTTSAGGYFSFDSVPLGSSLSASGSGYTFGPVTVNDAPYFILNGVVGTTPAPIPAPPSPTPPPVTPTPSANGTKATTITDGQGGVWTIGTDQETLRNGTHMGDGLATIYKYLDSTVYALGINGNWYKWTGSWSLVGTQEPGTTSPAPTPAPVPAPVPVPAPTPVPVLRKVPWPTGEAKQNAILDTQWKERYRFKKHLSGSYAEFERVP